MLKKSLTLFHELAAGVNVVHLSGLSPCSIGSGSFLQKLDGVEYIVGSRVAPQMAFLGHSLQYGGYSMGTWTPSGAAGATTYPSRCSVA